MTAQILTHFDRKPLHDPESHVSMQQFAEVWEQARRAGAVSTPGQLWERVAEGLIHEDLTRIAGAVKARKRAGLKLHVTPFSSRF